MVFSYTREPVTLIAYLVIAFLVGNVLAVRHKISGAENDMVMDMPLVYVGSKHILIFAAKNLVRKLLSYMYPCDIASDIANASVRISLLAVLLQWVILSWE